MGSMSRTDRPRTEAGSVALIWLASILRRTRRSAIVLALLIGATGGLVASAVATSHRIESSYSRMLDELDPPDALVGCARCDGDESDRAFTESLVATGVVTDVTNFTTTFPVLRTSAGELLGPWDDECATGSGELSTLATDSPGEQLPVRILSGRLPTSDSTDEVALAAVTASRAEVGVGDQILLTGDCATESAIGPTAITVVGIFVGVLDVRPAGSELYVETVAVSPAFAAGTGLTDQTDQFARLAPGRTLDELPPFDGLAFALPLADAMQERLRPDATAMLLFAALIGVAAIAVLGQLLVRQVRIAGSDHADLSVLGASGLALWMLGMSYAAVVGAFAAITAVATAVLLTPRMPLGAAALVDRGIDHHITLSALWAASAATVALVLIIAAVPAWSATRQRRAVKRPSGTATLSSRVSSRAGLGLTPTWGARLAFEPRRGRHPVPIRSGFGASLVAATVVMGVITFTSGLGHLRATPRLVGWNWDLVVADEDVDLAAVAAAVASHPDVRRSSLGTVWPSSISVGPDNEDELIDIALDTGPDAVRPVVVEGRAPAGPDEIVLSRALAERQRVDVGDVVDVVAPPASFGLAQALGADVGIGPAIRPFELVGIGVVPVLDGQLDRGAALTLDGIRRLIPPPTRTEIEALLASAPPERLVEYLSDSLPPDLAAAVRAAGPAGVLDLIASVPDAQLVALAPGAGPHGVYVELREGALPGRLISDLRAEGLMGDRPLMSTPSLMGAPGGNDAVGIVPLDLDDVAWIPSVIGLVMAFAAISVLGHLVTTGSVAGRRDLAVLTALGLRGRQVGAIVGWQAVALAVATASLATPFGVIAGRFAWHRYAEGLGVVPQPVTPWLHVALAPIVASAAGLLTAAVPGWRAARRRPMADLRSE
jgi:ABC-type lipoprotein release transport system permease subunit